MASSNKAPDAPRGREGDGEQALGLAVEIRSPDFDLTSVLRQYALDHLAAKLLKHARRIQSIVVRFEDRRAARDGLDMVCRVEVLIPGQPPLVVEEIESDLRAAIDLAADRIEELVQRDIERPRSERRNAGRKIVRYRKLLH
jgi:ribosomal subunit interface protein